MRPGPLWPALYAAAVLALPSTGAAAAPPSCGATYFAQAGVLGGDCSQADPCPSIAQAVGLAHDGDCITLLAGVGGAAFGCSADGVSVTKNLTIASASGTRASIDCAGNGRAFTVDRSSSSWPLTARILDVDVANGAASWGGCISVADASLDISGCHFAHCSANGVNDTIDDAYGGAVLVSLGRRGGRVVARSVVIQDASASHSGGGIAVLVNEPGSPIRIDARGSRFVRAKARYDAYQQIGYGGSLLLWLASNSSDVALDASGAWFEGCRAYGGGCVGVFASEHTDRLSVTLDRAVFADSVAQFGAGFRFDMANAPQELRNVSLSLNGATFRACQAEQSGGAIALLFPAVVRGLRVAMDDLVLEDVPPNTDLMGTVLDAQWQQSASDVDVSMAGLAVGGLGCNNAGCAVSFELYGPTERATLSAPRMRLWSFHSHFGGSPVYLQITAPVVDSRFDFSDGFFENCSSVTETAVIDVSVLEGADVNTTEFTFAGSTFRHVAAYAQSANGGGVSVDIQAVATDTTVNCSRCAFDNATSGASGGGLAATFHSAAPGAVVDVSGASVRGAHANGYGGAFSVDVRADAPDAAVLARRVNATDVSAALRGGLLAASFAGPSPAVLVDLSGTAVSAPPKWAVQGACDRLTVEACPAWTSSSAAASASPAAYLAAGAPPSAWTPMFSARGWAGPAPDVGLAFAVAALMMQAFPAELVLLLDPPWCLRPIPGPHSH